MGSRSTRFATKAVMQLKAQSIFSLLFLAASILLLSSSATDAAAQAGSAISGQIVTPQGTPAANARLTICPYTATGVPCSPQANIYSDPSLQSQYLLPQPYALNQYGNFAIWVSPGSYIVQISVNLSTTYSYVYSTGGGANITFGTGVPANPCTNGSIYFNTATTPYTQYVCNSTTWQVTGNGGAPSVALILIDSVTSLRYSIHVSAGALIATNIGYSGTASPVNGLIDGSNIYSLTETNGALTLVPQSAGYSSALLIPLVDVTTGAIYDLAVSSGALTIIAA
jgi:hypothetical protein